MIPRNAAVVPSVCPCVDLVNAMRCGSVVPSVCPCGDLVNAIESTLLHISLSNMEDMLTMMRGCTLLIVCFFIRLEQSVFNYPRATLLWFRGSVRLSVRGPCECDALWFRGSVRLSVRGPCECDRVYTVAYFFVKLGRHVNHDERMDPIDCVLLHQT